MDTVKIRRNDKGQTCLFEAWHAQTLWQRLRGLIAHPRLKRGEGLLITPCSSVHTIGMRYPLDLVFLDKHGNVLKCVAGLPPLRMAAARKARHTLELPTGSIAEAGIAVGDRMTWTRQNAQTPQMLAGEQAP